MVRRSIRLAWLRGFLPAAAMMVLWVVSTQTWTVAQFGGPSVAAGPPRFGIGRGVFIINWGWPKGRMWLGPAGWSLGVLTNGPNGPAKPSFVVSRQRWAWSELDWVPEVGPGHIKIPLAGLALFLALPPAGLLAWRRTRRLPGECTACGYDLRGIAEGACPECGTRAPPRSC
ncbi:MAG: hypothetical protein IT437_09680 [Phycisphaerales bacterium]|nr:hypothetical protein [Phycisphaerales bacterium]